MKIGDVIHLTGQWRNENEEFHYRCKIIDMDKNHIYIDYPIDTKTDKTVFIPIQEPFYVRFFKEAAVFQFETEVIARTKKVMPVLKLSVPSQDKFQKIQRRAYLRVDTTIDIAIHCPEHSFTPFTTITKDISGGGVRFIIPTSLKDLQLKREQPLEIYLVLRFGQSEYEYISIEGNVVRLLHDRNPVEATLSFQHHNVQQEQQLVRYCFQIQREERQQRQ